MMIHRVNANENKIWKQNKNKQLMEDIESDLDSLAMTAYALVLSEGWTAKLCAKVE